jgi:AraC-like DNA-binding protein
VNFTAEGRLSDSPYVESVWRGQVGGDTLLMCPVDGRWNFRLVKRQDKVTVSVEGPITKAKPVTHIEGIEWVVIKFKLGVFIPHLTVPELVDDSLTLPQEADKSFELNGSSWQFFDFDNADTFIDQLVRQGLLVHDPVVTAALQNQPQVVSRRTVRRRFSQATGLSPGYIHQIERARQAADLLREGVSILDTVFQAGYADQSHLTRSLKHFLGETPAQIAQTGKLW